MRIDELKYVLSRQVPDMARGFTIETNYGPLYVTGDLALQISALVEKVLAGELLKKEGEI